LIPDYLQPPEKFSGKKWGTLEKSGEKFWKVKGHPYMITMAKRLFPGASGRDRGVAYFPNSKRYVGELNWFMMRFPLIIKEKKLWENDLKQAQEHFSKQEQFLKKPKKANPSVDFIGELKNFQKEGLAFLLHNPRSLLADEMGLGKTPTALAWLMSNGLKPPLIIVVPQHIVKQ